MIVEEKLGEPIVGEPRHGRGVAQSPDFEIEGQRGAAIGRCWRLVMARPR